MSKTKTSKRKNSHRVPLYRRPWAIIIFFLILAAAVVLALIFIRPRPADPATTSGQSTSADNSTATSSETETTTPVVAAEPENKTTQYEGEDPNTLEQLTGSLTRKGVDNGVLTVVAVIDQYLQAPGYCTIILKNSAGQTVYSASSNAIPDVTASICNTFEIPITSFASGRYQIEIELSSDNKQGIITDEVEL